MYRKFRFFTFLGIRRLMFNYLIFYSPLQLPNLFRLLSLTPGPLPSPPHHQCPISILSQYLVLQLQVFLKHLLCLCWRDYYVLA